METKSLTVAIQVCISIFKKCDHQLIIPSLLFCLASRSLSCTGTNGCEDLDSFCMVKKIGTFFGVSSKIWLSWIKEWSVAMGLLKNLVTYFNPKVSIRSNLTLCWKTRFELKKGLVGWDTLHTVCVMYKQPIFHHLYQFSPIWGSDGHFWGADLNWFKSYDIKCKYFCFPVFVIL